MVTSYQKRSADQAPNGINGGGVAGPFMPAWCLICAALLACLSPAPPTKSLDLSLTLTNNVIHVNDVPEHLLTMFRSVRGSATLPATRTGTFSTRVWRRRPHADTPIRRHADTSLPQPQTVPARPIPKYRKPSFFMVSGSNRLRPSKMIGVCMAFRTGSKSIA